MNDSIRPAHGRDKRQSRVHNGGQMAPAPSAEPESKSMSELARLTGVVWSPGLAFRDIAAHPRWWPPLVIVIVISLVFTYAFTQRVGWERTVRQQLEANPRTQNLPSDQREQAIAAGARYAPIGAYGMSLVGFPVMALATAGVFLLVFRAVLGADLSFRQVLAIVCYARGFHCCFRA
jgi:hypothetical protein